MKERFEQTDDELGGQMSFLMHLDEFRRRLVNSVIIIVIAFMLCWFVSDKIYDFLSVPIRQALSEAERNEVPVSGFQGDESIKSIGSLKAGDTGRYIFGRATKLGPTVISPGSSVLSIVANDAEGNLGLFSDETLIVDNAVIPKGIKLPVNFEKLPEDNGAAEERMIVTTAMEAIYALRIGLTICCHRDINSPTFVPNLGLHFTCALQT